MLGSLVSRLTHRNSEPQTTAPPADKDKLVKVSEKVTSVIDQSNYLSRDLSWLKFNERVLDQARDRQAPLRNRTIMERLKFLAISASNLDEFFMIRVGSLYNYLDYHKQRVDYSGLRRSIISLEPQSRDGFLNSDRLGEVTAGRSSPVPCPLRVDAVADALPSAR